MPHEIGKSLKGKKVLLTGGAGLVGSAFMKKLQDAGADILAFQHVRTIPHSGTYEIIGGDLKDAESCKRACDGIHTVIHAAGVSGGSKKVTVQAIPMYTDNLLMNTQLLEAARISGVKQYLFISNSSVYAKSDQPLKEEDAYSGFPENETGMVKRAGETQCTLYAKFTDIKIAIMRAGNAFGPYDNFDLEASHVIPALIRKAVEKQNPYRVWGDGNVVRDFIFTEDIAEAGLFLLENSASAEPVNIASGRCVTIRQVTDIILKITGYDDAEIEFDTSAPPASKAKRIDIGKMRELGFRPPTSLEDGLAKTIAWFKEHGGFQT